MLKLLKLKQNRRGFTLLEVLLVVALIGLLAGIGTPVYQSFQNRNDLDIAANSFVQSLRRAQALARAVDGDTTWGVLVATSTITVFRGLSYAERDSGLDEVVVIPESISITGTQEYVFTKFSGELSESATTTLTSVNAEERIVNINEKGTITY